MDSAMKQAVIAQFDVMIALLARLTFGSDTVREIVVAKKRTAAAAYVKAYNALDGELGVVEVAKLAKLDKSNLSKVLRNWATAGIIYDVGDASKPAYKHVLAI